MGLNMDLSSLKRSTYRKERGDEGIGIEIVLQRQ